ncbi:MAG TPA: glycoside hydrolase family 18 protein [Elusimicrobiota bacterium]|nr:glycoside hydrolase family 18 protein [Elusimicrobiota bacterium]
MNWARALALFLLAPLAVTAGAEGIWVTGYYTGWRQGRLKPREIDFGAVTQLVHFGVVPRADGTLDAAVNMMTPDNVASAVKAAHEAGVRILFTVGGQGSRERFEGAISDAHRDAFVAALVKFMRDNGYDGIDVDMEDLPDRDARAYARFIKQLRSALDEFSPRPMLTGAALWQPELFASLADEFDRIDLMTYDLSGPYPGWVVWHSGALYDGGRRFPNGRARLPSVDGVVESFLAAGVPRAKLGVGLSFNGYVWSGGEVSRPGQAWSTPPSMKNVPYYSLADAYHITEYDPSSPGYHWDDQAQAAYLSVEGASPADAQFVSYENAETIAKMAAYVRGKGLGGMIIWDLGAGYRADQPDGRKDVLLQAVKKARAAAPAAPGKTP